MARQRRGSGGRRPGPATPLDLSSTLGSLLRTTLEQVSVVGEAALERARASRDRGLERASQGLDTVVLERRRRDALAKLGTAVYRLALRGELDLVGERADIARLLARIEDLDAQLDGDNGRDPDNGDDGDDDDDDDDDGWGFEVHRAAQPGSQRVPDPGRGRSRRRRDEDDEPEVVSSSSDWKPPRPRERMRVWRPTRPAPHASDAASDDAGSADEAANLVDTRSTQARGRGRSRRLRRMEEPGPDRASRGGGIAFVDDDVQDAESELAEYMHDDDVADRET